jgi:quercetin dioxygenase-like cupin family protein
MTGQAARTPRARRFACATATHAAAACAIAAAFAAAAALAQDDLATRLVRREIQRAPSSLPGREIVQVLTEIPPGIASGWHTHPGEEVGYILAGDVEMRVAGRATMILRAGDGFLIPPRTPHNARDIGPETGRMLSTYLVEPGQPLATLTPPPAPP